MKTLLITILLFLLGCSNTSSRVEGNVIVKTREEIMDIEVNYIEKAPKDSIGLALSGGGVRSASFNIGFLGGLYNRGVLDDIDYISSVSGGGFAAYWYFTKLNWNQEEEENFFKMRELYEIDETVENDLSKYRFQEYLELNMKMGRYPLDASDSSLDSLKTAGSITWRSIYNFPFALVDTLQISRLTENNFTPLPDYMRNSIERIYGFYPEKGNTSMSKSRGEYTNRGEKSWRLEKFGFEELKKMYESNKGLPLWIIGTTADVNNNWPRWTNSWKEAPELSQSYFEFTPITYGNEWYGFHETLKISENISHFVQTSSAAIDSANTYNLKSSGILTSFVSTGNYVELEKESVYLTDGGHSENLGVYPLIKRGVGKIIISDAEYGLGGRLTGLVRLIENLKDEYIFSFEDDEFNNYIMESRIATRKEESDLDLVLPFEVKFPSDLPVVLKGVVVEKTTGNKMEIYYIKLKTVKEEIRKPMEEMTTEDKKLLDKVGIPEDENEKFMEDATSNMWYSPTKYRSYFILGEILGSKVAEVLEKDSN